MHSAIGAVVDDAPRCGRRCAATIAVDADDLIAVIESLPCARLPRGHAIRRSAAVCMTINETLGICGWVEFATSSLRTMIFMPGEMFALLIAIDSVARSFAVILSGFHPRRYHSAVVAGILVRTSRSLALAGLLRNCIVP